MPGAWSVTCLSMSAHAVARCPGSLISLALFMASLIDFTLSSGQFELFVGRMLSPLNVGSSIVCGSEKSFAQPTLGQTCTPESGTLQYFVNIVLRFTRRSFTLKPISDS